MKKAFAKAFAIVMAMAIIMGISIIVASAEEVTDYPEVTAIWSRNDHSVHPAKMSTNGYYVAMDGYTIECPDGPNILKDYIDTNRSSSKSEGVAVKALYVFECSECGAYNSGYAFSDLNCYKCTHNCTGAKVYRFIVVPFDSTYYKSYSSVNMVSKTRSYFKDTAGNYGDGKDLPQSALKYEDGKLVGFSKTSVSIPNWRAFLQYILYPISKFLDWGIEQNMGESPLMWLQDILVP